MQEIVDYGILGILLLMSILSVSYALERFLFYAQVNVKGYTNRQHLELMLTKRLSIIATIASNAPYVGLLGTVLGIMLTFYTIGEQGMTDTRHLMTGLALALKATAFGLLVAIPSIVFYNALVRRCEEMLTEWDIQNAN